MWCSSTRHRPHQDLNQRIPVPKARCQGHGSVRGRNVLGGIIHDYYGDAALRENWHIYEVFCDYGALAAQTAPTPENGVCLASAALEIVCGNPSHRSTFLTIPQRNTPIRARHAAGVSPS